MKSLHFFIPTASDNQELRIFNELEKLCGSQLELLSQYEKLALAHVLYCYLHASEDLKDYSLTDALFDALQSAITMEENQKVCRVIFILDGTSRSRIFIFTQFVVLHLP